MLGTVLGLAWAAACAPNQANVKPEGMSAEQHRAEAERERQLAQEDKGRYDPGAARPIAVTPVRALDTNGPTAVEPPVVVYNPTDKYLSEADAHRKHAREHEKAAAALEKFEKGACRDLPERTRSACPLLGPVTAIDDVKGGVRVTFTDGTRIDALVAEMRCHYAYAQTRGFADSVSCPLYMPGLEIKQSGGAAVEITVHDQTLVNDLRAKSREEAAFVPQSRN
jgi:hypothetical protein